MENITGKRSDPVRKNIAQKMRQHCYTSGPDTSEKIRSGGRLGPLLYERT